MRSVLIGAVVGALVVASALAIRGFAPAHPVFQTYFMLVVLLLVPPILVLSEVGAAIPAGFDVDLLRYAAYMLANAVVYAAAAYWLDRTQQRALFLRIAPLVFLPVANLFIAGFRAMANFDP